MEHLKNYTERRDGKFRKNKTLKMVVPEESVRLVMEKMGDGIRQAELRLLESSLEIYGQVDQLLYLIQQPCGEWYLQTGIAEDVDEDDIIIEPTIFLA